MLAARVGAGRRDGEVVTGDDGDDLLPIARVLNPDAPDRRRQSAAFEPDVAAGVDRVVPPAELVGDRGCPVDRPALDEAGRVDVVVAPSADVEEALRLAAQLLAAGEDLAHVRVRVCERKLAAVEPADLAVRDVGAERPVDEAEPVEQRVEGSRVVDVADVDDDRHAHDLLDAGDAERRRSDGHDYQALALRIADCSDCANPPLVSVAPETMSILVLCARIVSWIRIGSACWLMKTERSVWFG